MNDSEKSANGGAAAHAATNDPVSRDRTLRVLALMLLIAVTVRLLVGETVSEQIWIGLTVVIVGGIVLMSAGILGLWICFGEAKIGVWLSPAHRRKQSIAFICGALISAACYYHYFTIVR